MQKPVVRELNKDIVLVGIDFIEGEDFKEDLVRLLEVHKPDTLGLALCEKRFETMEEREEWRKKPLLPEYKEGMTSTIIYQAFIDAVRENIRIFQNVEPETHIAQLVPLTKGLDLNTEFIDMDVTLVLARAMKGMSPSEKLRMVWYFKASMLSFSEHKKSKTVIDMDMHDDMVDGVLTSVSKFAPITAEKAKNERIEYLSKKVLEHSKKGKILAVIPESKLKEVTQKLREIKSSERKHGKESGYQHLEEVTKRVYTKALRFVSPVFFISLAVYLFFFSDVLNIWRAWLYWFLAVGGMAALGASLARGHPLSIITSFFLAPFMSLTLIGPGWIAGYVELKVIDPKVSDIKEVTSCSSANEFLSNNVIKVFMVGIFANVFTWVGLFIVLPLFIAFIG